VGRVPTTFETTRDTDVNNTNNKISLVNEQSIHLIRLFTLSLFCKMNTKVSLDIQPLINIIGFNEKKKTYGSAD